MAVGDIEHWVVLMMENRSFDHLFGYLKMPGIDNLLGGGTYAVDGVDGKDAYVFASTGAKSDYITKPDPKHEYKDVTDHIFGVGNPPTGTPTMRGFVQNFKESAGAPNPLDVMRCFRPQDVPVLTTLAQNYVLCDRWFCSVPSSTWPNRYFMHAATSEGYVDLDSGQCRDLLLGTTMKFESPTLFGRVKKAGKDWRIYFHNPPHASTLAELAPTLNDKDLWREFDPGNGLDGFAEHVANNDLPFYTFIEPQFDPTNPNNPMIPDNSGHPSGDFTRAQELIREVYNSLRQSDLWMSTALIVLFDEHGGFYDHVPPPSVTPDGAPAKGDFKFDRLGPRVPALVISPWVQQGVVDHGPSAASFYDHTSIAATIIRTIKGQFLTKRDQSAATLDHVFDSDRRHDCLPTV